MAPTAPTIYLNVYKFKITLKGPGHKIWRTIEVPEKYNFWELHAAIQDAMGWKDQHLHQFVMKNPKTGKKVVIAARQEDEPMVADCGFAQLFELPFPKIPEKTAKITEYFLSLNDKARYKYDFGDRWEHKIVLESILPAIAEMEYPHCIEGALACPPEDCGGVFGYRNLLKILANPQDEEYAEMKEWLVWIGQSDFNPENFDAKLVKFLNPDEHWKSISLNNLNLMDLLQQY